MKNNINKDTTATMTLAEAKELAKKSPFARLPYGQALGACKLLIVEVLKNENSEITQGALFAKTGMGFNHITENIYALRALVKAGVVKYEHRMVDGYHSTHFVSLAH